MIEKAIDAITKGDIDAVIANGVTESKTLDFKRELPGSTDSHRKEFLADVSSFANASGGDIVFGLEAELDDEGKKTGTAKSVRPIVGTTADEAKLRLEETIRNGIDPRLRVQMKEIVGWGSDGRGFVILLRIPKSFASPHMVTFRGTSRFFSRHSAGKYELDVHELRSAFLATESQAERIKRFREGRLGHILAGETPVLLSDEPRLVLHLIPIAQFLNNERFDLSNTSPGLNWFLPISGRNTDYRYNLDGFVTWIPTGQPEHGYGYCQVFFDGTVEAVCACLGGTADDGRYVIASDYEEDVVRSVEGYLKGYLRMGIVPPVAISLSLLGCKGACLRTPSGRRGVIEHPIDRDVAVLPDVVVGTLDVDVPRTLKPAFDAIWNACGFPHSFNYDKDGNWNPHR